MSERTREPDRTVPERERRSSGGNAQASARRRPSQSQRTVDVGEAGNRPGAPEREKRTGAPERERRTGTPERERKIGAAERERRTGTTEQERRIGAVEQEKRTGAPERERRTGTPERERRTGAPERERKTGAPEREKRTGAPERERRTGTPERNRRAGTTAKRTGRTSERSRMDYDSNMSSRDIERARRREERLRRVRRQKIIMAASATIIVLCLITILIFFLSPAKCILSISRGDKYARSEEYDKALEAYQEAIEINEKSVRAYRGAAGCLRMKEQTTEAEQLLYKGWEKTKDEGILRYYNKLLINEAVADINAGNCTQTTVDKLNRVLMNDPENLDALALMDTCKQRMARE